MQTTLAFAPDRADLADVWFDLSSGVLTYARSDALLMADEGTPEEHDEAADSDQDDDEDDEDEDEEDDEEDEEQIDSATPSDDEAAPDA